MMGRPTATKTILEARASLLSGLRSFFEARQSLEVDVPAIAKAPASDPWLDSFTVNDPAGLHVGYLLTSPETYLKRLLSEYQCAIHAIGKAYRANEEGSEHAIEFTMLEWYRPTSIRPFQAMVSEIQDLVETLTEYGRPEVIAYSDVFEATYGLNPIQATTTFIARFSCDLLG
jgi:lysyl-tRNA synthetase class 2